MGTTFEASRNKVLFMCRGLILPLTHLSEGIVALSKLVHSAEYFLITNKILRSEEAMLRRRWAFKMSIIFFFAVMVVVARWGSISGRTSEDLSWFLYVHFGLTVPLHFWTDSVLYSMKTKENREFVGKVLAS
jgi:quinol-cytochrome oxidoreductase complex cytochrome b subunit